jgi:hypothetical protein
MRRPGGRDFHPGTITRRHGKKKNQRLEYLHYAGEKS